MAEYKRQHFVPRCYFRPFSLNNEGKAVNLYNISRSRAVRNASIRDQCSRDYLYGKDLRLEFAFRAVEGDYARILRNIEGSERGLTENELQMLREFMVLQYSRTEAAIQRTRIMIESAQNKIASSFSAPPPQIDMSADSMMTMTLQLYNMLRRATSDLKVCLVRNRSTVDFITSDDPVILTSRFHAQKLKSNTFGAGSAGTLFYFPLSPRLLLVCYDGDIYTAKYKNEPFLSFRKKEDVFACNELQYLKSHKNIYFYNWCQKERIEKEFGSVAQRRQDIPVRVLRFVQDGELKEATRYRRIDEDEGAVDDTMLIALSPLHTLPTKWMSQVSFRDKLRYRYDGSAAGYVREYTWRER